MRKNILLTAAFSLLLSLLPSGVNGQALSRDTLPGLMGQYFISAFVPYFDDNYVQDTVSLAYEKYYLQPEMDDWAVDAINLDPEYYKLFVPLTLYHSALDEYSSLEPQPSPLKDLKKEAVKKDLPIDTESFTSIPRRQSQANKMLMGAYVNLFDRVVFTEDSLDAVQGFTENVDLENSVSTKKAKKNIMATFEDRNQMDTDAGEAGVEIHKPNWWTITGNGSFQLTQNFVSDNWYKGGESHNTLLATLFLAANYNNKDNIQWENSLDAKLGFASTPSDQVHKYLANTNQLRLYSKLGIQAAKNWYYTMSAEAKSQIVSGFNANDPLRRSAFLAPADVSVALGLDYKKTTKNVNFSLFLAPLTWTMRYVNPSLVDPVSLGVAEGRRVRHNFGSQFQPTLSWKITSNITLDSRLNYLTSYEWVRVEWENTLNMALNRYLSTKLYVFARYDDSAKPTVGTSYFQLNEILSFGINYNW